MKSLSLLLFVTLCFQSFFGYAETAHIYSFQGLSKKLGYPNKTYFGAPEKERADLEIYTEQGETYYKEINDYLRFFPNEYNWTGTSPEDAKLIVTHMDHLLARQPSLPKDLLLFRGVDLNFRGNQSYSIGEEFIEKAYVSTSTDFKVAKYFAVEMRADEEGNASHKKAIFVFYINRPELKGVLIGSEERASEEEVLLPHSQKIRVMALRTKALPYDLYLAQICPKTCDSQIRADVANFWKKFIPVK